MLERKYLFYAAKEDDEEEAKNNGLLFRLSSGLKKGLIWSAFHGA